MFSSDYGFIVDYLAEVLKYLRKEDHTKSYQEFFELSNTITTRDKTAIEKTFSGLVKVIYPNGEFSMEEGKELLDFAIECPKRVKDQLRKMDETFNDEIVKFEYTTKDGKVCRIETLEVLEYGDARLGILPEAQNKSEGDLAAEESYEAKKDKKELSGSHKAIRDNQTNISYRMLFGDYLAGATNIIVKDPYIRLPYQLRNFMELANLIAEIKMPEDEVKLHLVTYNNEDYISNSKESFAEIADSLAPVGIDFSYEFCETQHDRSIELNNGWKIILGRGLDIWQKTNGRYDLAEYSQERRLCKEFEVTIIQND